MKREWPLVALGVLALFSDTAAAAQTRAPQAARPTVHTRAPPVARVAPYHATPTRSAASHGVTAGSAATAAPSAVVGRVAARSPPHGNPSFATLPALSPRPRPMAMAVPSAKSMQHRPPVNTALGGPSTFDARRLVRR